MFMRLRISHTGHIFFLSVLRFSPFSNSKKKEGQDKSTTMGCVLWDYDDVPRCTRSNVLYYYPLCVGGASLAFLTFKSLVSLSKKRELKLADAEENRPLLASPDAYGAVGSSEASQAPQRSLKARHFDLCNLVDTNDDGTPHGQRVEVPKTTADRLRVTAEYICVIFELAMAVATLFVADFEKEWRTIRVSIVICLYWLYAFALCSVRVINISRVRIRLPSLWAHSTALYMFYFIPAVVFFRSALIGNIPSSTVSRYYEASFVLCFILVLLTSTATVGDKPGHIYVTSDGTTPSPETVSSLLSFSTYSWIDKMIWKASKAPLAKEDIWGLREDDYALHVLQDFESKHSTMRFTFKLFSHFKVLFMFQAFWALLESIIVFAPSILLKKILEYVSDPTVTSKSVAWCIVILMPLAKMADSTASGFSLFLGRRVCVRMRAIIIGEVYAKALRRKITVQETEDPETEKTDKDAESKADSKDASRTAELGAIINLMAIDAFKVSEICGYLHFFVGSILMLVFCIGLLYALLGWSALAGGAAIIVLLPMNVMFSRWSADVQKVMLGTTDKRIQKMNETFSSIRIIKFFAWEDNFFRDIMNIRREELHYLRLRTILWVAQTFLWFFVPTLVTVISFYCYTVIQGNELTASIAFTALSLFTLLRSPLDQLADMIAVVIQSKVSLDRVSDFLEEAETSKYDQLCVERSPSSPIVGFENASFSWNSSSDKDFKLKNLNIAFKPGKLNIVIGPTGSGKTSLLLALLGEMDLTSGKVFLPGIIPRDDLVVDPRTGLTESVAYCSQSAWLLNDTIRNNITFATPFNQDRYDKVVEACGLTRDLEILAAGDRTEIGEKGIALSGGQKQRVSLARALYSNSRHLLLDDCLSAVDSHTALWIYENCISGPLMANRTCILVSHNVALTVQKAEWIVVMNNGVVQAQGLPEDLLRDGHLGDDDMVQSSVMNSRSQSSVNLQSLESKNSSMKAKAAAIEDKLQKLAGDDHDEDVQTDGKLVEEESKSEGIVDSKVYIDYAKEFGGWTMWTFIFAIFILPQAIYILQSWWLKKWAQENTPSGVNVMGISAVNNDQTVFNIYNSVLSSAHLVLGSVVSATATVSEAVTELKKKHEVMYYIIIYAAIGITYAFVATFRVLLTFFAGIRASNRIFKRVLTKVLSARLRFFDKTPLGRIMNRFSKDIESVDQELTPVAEGVFACFVTCVSVLGLITFITPGFLVFAILIAYLYFLVGSYYITLSRELKRYDSITKSPIHQHFSESLVGVATIRAYGVETRFMKQNLTAIDNNNKPFFYMWVANRWLSWRTDAVGSMVMFLSGVFVLLSIGKIDAGLAGLSLSYAISFSESALWIVRLYANIEMNMNSVERLQEFLEIEQEPPSEIPETEPRPTWPEHGEIDMENVTLRYAPHLPRVIKNVTFHVDSCNKIGIVGRTGAGKSTIITALFRFLDPETGTISIDGVDISKIGLRNLRQAITIIPQDPTLFSGTIRSNLDPFNQYTDSQIFEALTRVNLISPGERESSTSGGDNQNKFLDIESVITEGGNNLSQGQRQLMCLARSLLKSPKVILLDEATASIDYKSDALIQQTIRDEFSSSTILTIAHRLRSIIDYDKILVMDAGRVVEYDDPYTLIANSESLFHSMCENSGELDTLTKLAKEAFVRKKNHNI
ncbi:putative ATP-dependent bile acid permease [Clavispora lusitaniae]|uniref:ATP-dependent bile acid permease n=1 Tax=Clavispora lusitaniae TaxID=36911 RepID=A0ACD0WH61_CLALS|nr:putative ATP-dependent bile acid permease [Clavispora lusitaniae]QFZ32303.1 putative ATP-dependent bile acid permease [Clavispora lusitaniae]QFZ37972.1 putative ATP-dependent bile acid permease [Clavispora lusitaniae]QFZ43655.1 putative ATP-dependent bile acid permease [Clavispora lusitaniae]QFZ49332.1 putative ATP-dependent bile acid permease [Clavispora lusitaniae]